MASDAELHNDASLGAHLSPGFEEVERQVCFGKSLFQSCSTGVIMIRKTQTRIGGSLVLAALLAAGVTLAAETLEPVEAASHVGEEVTVCGEVTGAKYSSHRQRKPTFIDFGPPHPNQHFTALIWGEYRDKFDYVPESLFGKTICVSGTITEYKGKAEIKVSDRSQIRIMED